jgi:Tfp pilus assembly protein PilP
MTRPGIWPLALGLGFFAGSVQAQPPGSEAGEPTRPGLPSAGAVKQTVTSAMKEAAANLAARSAPEPSVAVAEPAPADPASRAAALRRKTLREADFLDNDESNRDPFKSFMRLFVDRGVVKTRQIPAIFEKFALEELALIAVVSGDAQPRAMFRDPGGLGQTVKRGDYISKAGARITKILSDRVILEIPESTSAGAPRVMEKAVLVHPEEEAQK